MERPEIFHLLRNTSYHHIKHGQIHVSNIWKKCGQIKSKGIGYKYINELGWREFYT